MGGYDDYSMYEQEAAMGAFLENELQRLAEEPVFLYLASFGDEIEMRVNRCLAQAQALCKSGYYGASLTRAVTGIEITIRFFLVQPLLQGAFLSDDWAYLLSKKIFANRIAEDRKLLPAILRNWKIDITNVKLSDGSQAWEQFVSKILPHRDNYVHKADDTPEEDALLAWGPSCRSPFGAVHRPRRPRQRRKASDRKALASCEPISLQPTTNLHPTTDNLQPTTFLYFSASWLPAAADRCWG